MSDYLNQRRQWKQFGKPKEEKPVYQLRKKSLKKLAEEAEDRESGTDEAMDKWFEARRKEMTGKCQFCGGKTEKSNDETYRRSIAHLLPKRPNQFPSVKTHPDNWLELCFWNPSCHTNFDSGMISMELLHDSAEWKIIADKFRKIYPHIVEAERKNIHPLLLKEIQ